MEILKEGTDLNGFWSAVADAPARVLLLDYDGTLAPFRVERDRATPYPEVRHAVERILEGGHTRVVVISGRAVDHLLPLLGLDPPPEIWGSHGWEHLEPGKGTDLEPLPEAAREGLRSGREAAREVAPAERIELKPVSVAVHVRGMDAEDVETLLEELRLRWDRVASAAGLDLHAFDGGLELRVPGKDKGTAVTEALRPEPAGAAVAYLGDDLTDEDAFRVLEDRREEGGPVMTFLVREERRPTAARIRVSPPEELLDVLERWNRMAEGRGHGRA